MPFGLKNSAQAFQRLMDGVLRGLPFVFVYLDDILVASPSIAVHVQHVRQLLRRLDDAGLAINKEKCVFGVPSVTFLGHTVSARGIMPLDSKVTAIRAIPRPKTKVDLQRYLGCINFYHRFMLSLATVLAPLHALVSSVATQKAPLDWTAPAIAAFAASKAKLSAATLLVHPDPDPDALLSLTTDASDIAVGAVLGQGQSQAPLAFFSKKLTSAQKKYSAFDRELLALYLAVRHFRSSLEGRRFTIFTDHKPLCGAIAGDADRSPRQTRHLSFVAEYTTDIQHLSGASNVVADTLSRPADSPDAADLPAALVQPAVLDQSALPQINAVKLCPGVDFTALARAQSVSGGLLGTDSSLQLRHLPVPDTALLLCCDVSQGTPRPLVPPSMTKAVFDCFHGLSHAGGRATLREISRRFV